MSSGGFLPVFELKTTAEVENDVANGAKIQISLNVCCS